MAATLKSTGAGSLLWVKIGGVFPLEYVRDVGVRRERTPQAN